MALWILAVVFSLVGVPFILLARRTFAKDRAAAGWPRAPGKIVSSEVLTWNEKRRHDDGYYFDWTASRPAITYTYNVGGLEMEGKRIAREVEYGVIVFIVCDRGDRYLSTGVFDAR